MVFSSLTFLYLFLPVSLLTYFSLSLLRVNKELLLELQNFVLLCLSLLFYSWGEPKWVCILLISACLDFYVGKIIDSCRGTWKAKAAVLTSIVINLSLLGVFKYLDFFILSINSLLGVDIPLTGIKLPIGISFYTFQTMSYSLDMYSGQAKVQKSFLKFLLFVSLFPQLIAGPILRYVEIAEQLDQREHTLQRFSDGINRFVIGLGKKILLANHAGEIAGQLLGIGPGNTTMSIWLGIIMFTLQIYFDFSGYSDMAIGLGKMFGFEYSENFNYPYISRSITEFWRRWHISLGSFFKDYVYIPLGGNKKWQYRNIIIVWALTGLWHGASWNFVLWGMYFCIILIFEKSFLLKVLKKLPSFFSWLYAIIFVVIGWVLFYYTDMAECIKALQIMFGGGSLSDTETIKVFLSNIPFLSVCALASTPIMKSLAEQLRNSFQNGMFMDLFIVSRNMVIMLLCTVMLCNASFNPFIYFRF